MRPDYDALYNPRLAVNNVQSYVESWTSKSLAVRASTRNYLDIPYGPGNSEKIDIFPAIGRSRALMVFFHGGYWRSRCKDEFSFVAKPFMEAGITVAVPGYSLCPTVEVPDIVMQAVQCGAWLYRNGRHFGAPPDRLFVCGHSAGGHLATMLMACLWPDYAPDLPANMIGGAFSLSGLYDLRPLVHANTINRDVRLTARSAVKSSPALLPPATGSPVYLMTGSQETAGFHHQQDLLEKRWRGVARGLAARDANHFSILDRLADPDSDVHLQVLGMFLN